MAKKKSKAASTVKRRQDALRDPLASPKVHDRDGDGSMSLALPLVPPTKPVMGSCATRPDPLPSQHYKGGPSTIHPASEFVVDSGSKFLDGVVVEDCSATSDEETLEDRLDLNFSDEECGDPPLSPARLSAEKVSPPLPPAEKILSPALEKTVIPSSQPSGWSDSPPSAVAGNSVPGSSKWRDLFPSKRSTVTYTKLQHFSLNHLSRSCDISPEDIQTDFDVWKLCAVGYVSGKRPGFGALNSIISNVWKCEAHLSIHDSGWLVYRFKTEEDKLSVLSGGPYLIYGRPLILWPMTKFFDFSNEEMSRVPVWVKFPNLPLCCGSPICLSKIASVLGNPIQCDQPTSTLSRISYARVLVEIDLLEELRHSVEISLPEGLALCQSVVYEALPKYCNFCHVLGHARLLCPKAVAPTQAIPYQQPLDPAIQADKGNVHSRLGPQPPPQPPPPLPQMQSQSHDDARPEVSKGAVRLDVDPVSPNVWVTVESKCKSKKQDKGKVVVASEPVLGSISPVPSPPNYTGPVQPEPTQLVTSPCAEGVWAPSPPCTESSALPPCAGNEHPPKTHTLATTVGDANMPGPPGPLIPSRVQTRS